MKFLEELDRRIAEFRENRQVKETEKKELEDLLRGLGKRAADKKVEIILAAEKDGIRILPNGDVQLPSKGNIRLPELGSWSKDIERVDWGTNRTIEYCIREGLCWRPHNRIAEILRLAIKNEVKIHLKDVN